VATIRPATAEDAEAVARLFRRVREASLPYLPRLHTPQEDLAFFRDRVLAESIVWVAEAEGELLGFIAAREGWIDHLYVDPAAHGAGLGSRLLAAALPACGARARLWTFQRNARARAFYERRGFTLVELTNGAGNEEREPDALYERRRSGATWSV
jgi:putative acetyltransferase